MRKWMVVAGLAAAFLAGALLLRGTREPPTPEVERVRRAAQQPSPSAPHPTPSVLGPGTAGEATAEAFHHGSVDEDTRAVLAYPITMNRLETYCAVVKEIRAAGERNPKLMAKLREPGPPGEGPAGTAARLESVAPLKVILDRHGLAGIDLVLVPQVVFAGRNAFALEQEGRPMPPDQVNAAAVALYRADLQRMDAITKAFLSDLRVLSGR